MFKRESKVSLRYTYHLEQYAIRAGSEGIVMWIRDRTAGVMFEGKVSEVTPVPFAYLEAASP